MYDQIESMYLKKNDVARVLGVCIRTLENMVQAGSFPKGVQCGKSLYWHPQIARDWLDSQFERQREEAKKILEKTHLINKRRKGASGQLGFLK